MQKLPKDFVERMKAKLGNEYPAYVNCLTDNPSVCVRKNPFKPTSLFYREQQLTYCKDAFILSERPHFHHDPLFHAGCYYVQEAGSVFLEHIFHQLSLPEHPVVLDLCAAPGGKSTHLLSLIHQKGVLVSNEIITSRNKILQQNIYKWGCDNAIITQSGSEHFKECSELFDLIIVDAPCSGEGLFRKDKDAVSHWSASSVAGCSRRQHEILNNVLPALKPGGYLVYSTCTFEDDENDHISGFVIREYGFETITVPDVPIGIEQTKYGLQFYPHKTNSEGFYISVLQKPASASFSASGSQHTFNIVKAPEALYAYLDTKQYHFIQTGKETYAVNAHTLQVLQSLSPIKVKSAGIPVGIVAAKYKPHPALALSNALLYNKTIELNADESLLYLSGQTPDNRNNDSGIHIITHQGKALGWVNAISGRLNNLNPHEWRILLR
jgi:16S rRNA C967 or C1407 C5-methylase (RsmB/RsmF family)/NOL1/NOP2/fmu family ribosome biogenesis protein